MDGLQQLPPAASADCQRDGFLSLGRVCAPALLASLQRRIDDIMLGEIVHPDLYMQVRSVLSGSAPRTRPLLGPCL